MAKGFQNVRGHPPPLARPDGGMPGAVHRSGGYHGSQPCPSPRRPVAPRRDRSAPVDHGPLQPHLCELPAHGRTARRPSRTKACVRKRARPLRGGLDPVRLCAVAFRAARGKAYPGSRRGLRDTWHPRDPRGDLCRPRGALSGDGCLGKRLRACPRVRTECGGMAGRPCRLAKHLPAQSPDRWRRAPAHDSAGRRDPPARPAGAPIFPASFWRSPSSHRSPTR